MNRRPAGTGVERDVGHGARGNPADAGTVAVGRGGGAILFGSRAQETRADTGSSIVGTGKPSAADVVPGAIVYVSDRRRQDSSVRASYLIRDVRRGTVRYWHVAADGTRSAHEGRCSLEYLPLRAVSVSAPA